VSWRFGIEVRRESGAMVGVADASAGHCVEDALFQSGRCGELANDGLLPEPVLEPLWQADHPIVTGLSVAFEGHPPRHYGRDVFVSQARELTRRLRADAKLDASDALIWNVVARKKEALTSGSIRTTREAFPLELASLPHVSVGSYEVRIDAAALRHLDERVRGAGQMERAELLLGRLRHDAERKAFELKIQDVVPLAPGRGGNSSIHFSFDPHAFVAARRAAHQRSDGLLPCGWHHNHNPCDDCFAKPQCPADWVFFSDDDQGVHASLFPRPHMVALVGGKVGSLPASRPGFRLFGWSRAEVRERSFRVVGSGAEHWDANHGAFVAPAIEGEGESCPTN